MKVKAGVKKRCKDCIISRRNGRLVCRCKKNPRHNHRQ